MQAATQKRAFVGGLPSAGRVSSVTFTQVTPSLKVRTEDLKALSIRESAASDVWLTKGGIGFDQPRDQLVPEISGGGSDHCSLEESPVPPWEDALRCLLLSFGSSWLLHERDLIPQLFPEVKPILSHAWWARASSHLPHHRLAVLRGEEAPMPVLGCPGAWPLTLSVLRKGSGV